MNKIEVAQPGAGGALKAVVGSLIGLGIFFVPLPVGEDESKIPLVMIIDYAKELLGGSIDYLTLGIINPASK
ncbi:hypothetical protein [Halomonas sp. 15WGF]|uniref:hypothetical protein n=1 Tax=Halomonas sp. 15WGF TaxID=2570357 RepID=UPI0010BF5009|nr:hypothetical protein [Halomonas sp. 15WGF]TKJ09666.1 hypothetical protein E8Q34_15405 [Halomonas sp. 15WGF]